MFNFHAESIQACLKELKSKKTGLSKKEVKVLIQNAISHTDWTVKVKHEKFLFPPTSKVRCEM